MTLSGNGSKSKILRLIQTYDIDEVGNELERRWTRRTNRVSLRKLAEYFNKELLQAKISKNSNEVSEIDIDNLYHKLTSDEVSSGVRTQAITQIEQYGVDYEKLRSEFVTRQAIHTYLSNVRDVSPPQNEQSSSDRREQKNDVIQRLKQRLVVVTEQTLTTLRNTEELTLGDFSVLVRIRIHCADCSTQHSVTELLTRGGCDCDLSFKNEG